MSNDEATPAFDAHISSAAIELPLPTLLRITPDFERCYCGVVHARAGTLNCGISRYPAALDQTEQTDQAARRSRG